MKLALVHVVDGAIVSIDDPNIEIDQVGVDLNSFFRVDLHARGIVGIRYGRRTRRRRRHGSAQPGYRRRRRRRWAGYDTTGSRIRLWSLLCVAKLGHNKKPKRYSGYTYKRTRRARPFDFPSAKQFHYESSQKNDAGCRKPDISLFQLTNIRHFQSDIYSRAAGAKKTSLR